MLFSSFFSQVISNDVIAVCPLIFGFVFARQLFKVTYSTFVMLVYYLLAIFHGVLKIRSYFYSWEHSNGESYFTRD